MATTLDERIKRKLDPTFKFFINRKGSIKNRMKFLLEGERMKNEYLGECLDYVRWGSPTDVMYDLGTTGLIEFIQHWMDLNKDNLIWTDEELPEQFRLPHIRYDRCPRNPKHATNKKITDTAGRTRCAHTTEERLRPSFIYESSTSIDRPFQTTHKLIGENNPHHHAPKNPTDWTDETKDQAELWNTEPQSVPVKDVCYAILHEPDSFVLPLETVLDRLNLGPRYIDAFCGNPDPSLLRGFGFIPAAAPCQRLDELDEWSKFSAMIIGICPGHEQENNKTVHPFDGWNLAWYVQKWHEQVPNGQAPVQNTSGKRNYFKFFKGALV